MYVCTELNEILLLAHILQRGGALHTPICEYIYEQTRWF